MTKKDEFLWRIEGKLRKEQKKLKTPGFDVEKEAENALEQQISLFHQNFSAFVKSRLIGPIAVDQGMFKKVLNIVRFIHSHS